MEEYITVSTVSLYTGIIGLEKNQALRRSYALQKIRGKKDLYLINQPVEFKVGEKIKLDPDKATLARLEPIKERFSGDERIKIEQEKAILEAAMKAVEAGDVIKSGAPKVTAIEELLGWDITESQRDKAWATMSENE